MTSRRTPTDFAALGGIPLFDEIIHVGRPNIGDRAEFLRLVQSVLDSRQFTNGGPLVRRFEAMLSEHLEVRNVVCVTNATLGLQLLYRALELQGEILLPSFTFVATAHSALWEGLTPVFCEISPTEHTIDPADVEQRVSAKTAAILGVHIWGQPCPIAALQEIASKRRIPLIFDAAHAFTSSYEGRQIGSFGEAEVFSFHATKFLNTFEGGAISTDSDELAHRLRLMVNFGFSGYDEVSLLGTNAKMSEVPAAMGLASLGGLDQILSRNRDNLMAYRKGLSDVAGVQLLDLDITSNNCQYAVAVVDEEVTGLSRDSLASLLWAENVRARRYFHPGCHRMEPYRSLLPATELPVTEDVCSRVLVLPTGSSVDRGMVRQISQLIASAIELAPLLRDRLAQSTYPPS
jgi:dTDP-4-amino-4,6-dideoxygalactose transaminase